MLIERSGMSSKRKAGIESSQTTVIFSDLKYTAMYETVYEGSYVAWLEEMRGVQIQGEHIGRSQVESA